MKNPTPPKTRAEKKLTKKYKKLLEATNDFSELQKLAIEFKNDLAVFLQKNRRYSMILLLFMSLAFGQSSIVVSGNQNETIGEVFPIMQTIKKESVPLSVPKFEIPIEQPKPIVEKKKNLWQKIILILKNLFK